MLVSFPAGHEHRCTEPSCTSPFSSTRQQDGWQTVEFHLLWTLQECFPEQSLVFRTGDLAGSQCKMSCSVLQSLCHSQVTKSTNAADVACVLLLCQKKSSRLVSRHRCSWDPCCSWSSQTWKVHIGVRNLIVNSWPGGLLKRQCNSGCLPQRLQRSQDQISVRLYPAGGIGQHRGFTYPAALWAVTGENTRWCEDQETERVVDSLL